MSEQQQEPLTIVEYYRTLPHWRKNLCHGLEWRVRRTGLDVGVWLYNVVHRRNYDAGFWLYKTMHKVSFTAGFWLSIVVSGYPWNKYRRVHRSQQDNEN